MYFCSTTSASTFAIVDRSVVNGRALFSYQRGNLFCIFRKDMWVVLILLCFLTTYSFTARVRIFKVLFWLLALFMLRLVDRAKCKLTYLISSFCHVLLQTALFFKKIEICVSLWRWWLWCLTVTRRLQYIIYLSTAVVICIFAFGSEMLEILISLLNYVNKRNSFNSLWFDFRNVWLPS
jgi:hypothetical protein